jgi:hypothetical protein
MPGQGASRGMHCRPPEAEQRILAYLRRQPGKAARRPKSKAGGSRLLQRNTTLTLVPPVTANCEASARERDGEGAAARPLMPHMFFLCSIELSR